jgi:hypothetical protein
MGFLDLVVGRCFRDEDAGRVVIFAGGPRSRGYLVKSQADELKIRAFLKMFVTAQLAIQLLGMLLTIVSSDWINYELGRPAQHLLRTSCVFLGIYSALVGLPLLLLWRSCRRARLIFVSPQDEVSVSSQNPAPRQLYAAALIFAAISILMLAIVWLVRFK